MLTERKVTMSQPTLVPDPNNADEVQEAEDFCDFYSNYIPSGSNCMEPMATIYYPIISGNLSNVQIEVHKLPGYPEEFHVDAVIALDFYWKVHLKDLLPSKSFGIVIVFENESSNSSFTYRIDGPKPIFMGFGDHHDPNYNYLSVHTDTRDLQSFMKVDDHYIGLPFDYETCIYKIHVYATEDMKNCEFMEIVTHIHFPNAI
jgi:hypothetical protein